MSWASACATAASCLRISLEEAEDLARKLGAARRFSYPEAAEQLCCWAQTGAGVAQVRRWCE